MNSKWIFSCLEIEVLDLQSERLHGRVVGRVEVGVGTGRKVAAADVGATDAVVETGVPEIAPRYMAYHMTGSL